VLERELAGVNGEGAGRAEQGAGPADQRLAVGRRQARPRREFRAVLPGPRPRRRRRGRSQQCRRTSRIPCRAGLPGLARAATSRSPREASRSRR
jgi:hypothetical protein